MEKFKVVIEVDANTPREALLKLKSNGLHTAEIEDSYGFFTMVDLNAPEEMDAIVIKSLPDRRGFRPYH